MIIISALIGVICYVGGTDVYTFKIDDPNYNAAAVDNINGSLFYALMVIGFGSVNNIVLLFPEERPIFLREVNNNMYSPSAYFFGKIVSELPSSFMLPFIFGCIEYFALFYSRLIPTNFILYSNKYFKIKTNVYSWIPLLIVSHCRKLRSHHWNIGLRQISCYDPYPHCRHSTHALRWLFHQLEFHPPISL